MRDWHATQPKPPDWLEVRLLELPGHGHREHEPLPFDEDEMLMQSFEWPPTELAHIAAGRDALVRQLVDEALPLLRPPDGAAAGRCQTALYGFSNGAMLVYLMAAELQRRGEPPPCCLLVAGRSSVHRINNTVEALLTTCQLDDEETIERMRAAGVITPNHSFATAEAASRFAQLARSDHPLGVLESGTRPDGAAVGSFTADAPRLACPLVALLSDGDTMWPAGEHLAAWAAVAPGPTEFSTHVIEGVPHPTMQANPAVRQAVIAELAAAGAALSGAGAGA